MFKKIIGLFVMLLLVITGFEMIGDGHFGAGLAVVAAFGFGAWMFIQALANENSRGRW